MREIIRRRLPARPARAPAGARRIDWWSGSPYLGLQAFDLAHSAVFFGRERAVRDIAEALARRAAAGQGFVVVLGASGVGKSSLARAGVAADLTAPGVVAGVASGASRSSRRPISPPIRSPASPPRCFGRALCRKSPPSATAPTKSQR